MIVILLGIIIILTYIIIHKRKQYKDSHNETIQDKMFLITLSKFVIHIKEHTDKEIITNDMVNAVKTCVNKELYEVTPVDDNYTQDNAYYSFAMQMFSFVDEMDKE